MKVLHNYGLRLLVIALLIVAGAFGTKSLIYYGLNHYSDDHKKFTELFRNNTSYDILMLGASRVRNHVNPAIIDSVTGYKSYNAGAEAANILEIKMILDAYLTAHPAPKLVVLNLDASTLDIHRQYIGFYPKYLEFKDIPPVAELLHKNRVRVGLYRLLPFLETAEIDDYNRGNMLKVALGQRKLPPGDFFYKGFESNTTVTMPPSEIPCGSMAKVAMEGEAIEAFEELIQTCKEQGMAMLFFYAPEYKRSNQKCISNFSGVMNYYDSVAARYSIPFVRHDTLALNDSGALFANVMHLNRKGAEVYSNFFAKQLSELGWIK